LPRLHALGLTLRLLGSNDHTSMLCVPAVTSVKASWLRKLTQLTPSLDVGEPQMAAPLSTSHSTRLLSSCPPMEARNWSSGEKHRSCTFTL